MLNAVHRDDDGMMVMSLFHVGAACLCQHQLSHANYMGHVKIGFVCRVYFCSTFVYTTGAMVNTFPWQAKGCWFDSSWRDKSPLCLHQKGDLKLCRIKHAELSAVASPSGKRVTASFFPSNNPPASLYLHLCTLLVKKSHVTWQFLGSRHCRPCGAASSRPRLSDGHRRHI